MELDITDAALEAFLAEAGDGPVVLVNLVRIRSGGRAAYDRYLEAIGPSVAGVGATAVWLGEAVPRGNLIDEVGYDRAAVVRYPDRQAVAALLVDPAFIAAAPLRHEALEAGILHAFHG